MIKGQGGTSNDDFHTGTYRTTYQGHAAGRETSENKHTINVYAQPLDVLKTDDDEQDPTVLSGAVFALYREAKDGETATDSDLLQYNADMTGAYVKLAEAATGDDGIARLAAVSDGMTAGQLLVPGETYYLIETEAPTRTVTDEQGNTRTIQYERDHTVHTVTVETEDGRYTDLEGGELSAKVYPFNWDQGARLLVDGTAVSVTVTSGAAGEGADDPDGDSGEEENDQITTEEVTDGSFVSFKNAVSFHTAIKNIPNEMTVKVQKQWENQDNPPEQITFELYRVAHIDHVHHWSDWIVVEPTCEEAGSRTRSCECGEEQVIPLPALGHDWEITEIPASCTVDGTITYTCRHDSSHTYSETIQAGGHVPGEVVIENRTEPTYESSGGYDEVVYCQVCGEELSRNHVVLEQLVKKTRITYRAYQDYYSRGVITVGPVVTSAQYQVGSTVTLSWDSAAYRWGQNYVPYNVTVYKDTQRNRTPGSYFDLYDFVGGQRPTVTRTQTDQRTYHYTCTITVSDGMNLDIVADNWGFTPYNITITQAARSGAGTASQAMRSLRKTAALPGSLSTEEEESVRDVQTQLLTPEQLSTLLAGYTPKDELEEDADDVTYIEKVGGTYTVTSDDDWYWEKDDLPRYDGKGYEYTYYVVETSPSEGYQTTYLGQSEGLHNGDTVTITNKFMPPVFLKKVDTTNRDTTLDSAEFDLYTDASQEEINEGLTPITDVIPGKNLKKVNNEKLISGSYEMEDDGDDTTDETLHGYVMIGNLDTSKTYYLVETKAPDGYDSPIYDYIRITITRAMDEGVSKDAINWITISQSSGSGALHQDFLRPLQIGHGQADTVNCFTVTVENTPGVELPSTGGPGTKLFYLFGGLLTAFAFAMLLNRKQNIQTRP